MIKTSSGKVFKVGDIVKSVNPKGMPEGAIFEVSEVFFLEMTPMLKFKEVEFISFNAEWFVRIAHKKAGK